MGKMGGGKLREFPKLVYYGVVPNQASNGAKSPAELHPPRYKTNGGKTKTKKRVSEKFANPLIFVVPRDGIEPSTRGFSVLCSTD